MVDAIKREFGSRRPRGNAATRMEEFLFKAVFQPAWEAPRHGACLTTATGPSATSPSQNECTWPRWVQRGAACRPDPEPRGTRQRRTAAGGVGASRRDMSGAAGAPCVVFPLYLIPSRTKASKRAGLYGTVLRHGVYHITAEVSVEFLTEGRGPQPRGLELAAAGRWSASRRPRSMSYRHRSALLKVSVIIAMGGHRRGG
jgi:hypothetical protein